jgi:hypothetical protein
MASKGSEAAPGVWFPRAAALTRATPLGGRRTPALFCIRTQFGHCGTSEKWQFGPSHLSSGAGRRICDIATGSSEWAASIVPTLVNPKIWHMIGAGVDRHFNQGMEW